MSAAFSPDGTRLVTAGPGRDRVVEAKVWDARTGEFQFELNVTRRVQPRTPGMFGLSVSFSPEGTRLAIGGEETQPTVWDVRTRKLLVGLDEPTCTSMAFSPDGARIVTGGFDGQVKVWDATTGKTLAELQRHGSAVNGVAFG